MITIKTVKTSTERGQFIRDVQTEYHGTIEDLTFDFLALLEDGLNDPDIRSAFNEAFKMFNEHHPLDLEVNNG